MSIRSLLPTLWPASGNGAHDPFLALRHEVDRAFEDFGRSLPSVTWPQDAVIPRVNVILKDKILEITAELPGVELKDLELLVEDDVLTIKGEKQHETEDKSEEHHLCERSFGSFSRTIPLPFEVEAESVSAAFKNGVLTVSVPVPADIPPKVQRVEIKAAG